MLFTSASISTSRCFPKIGFYFIQPQSTLFSNALIIWITCDIIHLHYSLIKSLTFTNTSHANGHLTSSSLTLFRIRGSYEQSIWPIANWNVFLALHPRSPDDSIFHNHRYENLRSYIVFLLSASFGATFGSLQGKVRSKNNADSIRKETDEMIKTDK
jgi:hypothetical protein